MGISANVVALESEKCLKQANTQMEMNQCAGVGYQEADVELNRVYQLIKKIYKNDKLFIERLKKVQNVWIKLRDADFGLQYPHKDEPLYYGSVFPMCVADLKARLTLQRVEFLKQWLVGAAEGDVCSGSQMLQMQLKNILKSEYIQ